MKFGEVIHHLGEGRKIRRKIWGEGHYWCESKNGLDLMDSSGTLVDDWEVYEEPNKKREMMQLLSNLIKKSQEIEAEFWELKRMIK